MAQNQGLPSPGYPLVDSDGKINPIWFQFMQSMWQRTGGGSNSGNVQSITVNSGSGIASSVDESTANAVINLTLGNIAPSAVVSSGPISGTTGYFSQGLSNFGPMQFGIFNNSGVSNTGYIEITDINGNVQKLMVGS